jgi:hypothetical protein
MFIPSPERFAEWFNEKIPDICRKIESSFPPDKPCRRAVPGKGERKVCIKALLSQKLIH